MLDWQLLIHYSLGSGSSLGVWIIELNEYKLLIVYDLGIVIICSLVVDGRGIDVDSFQ